jgi:RNA polymerase sigma-70 factor (ECF subfamily)
MSSSENDIDLNLLSLVKQNDHRAFEMIFDRYWYRMYRYAFAVIRSREDAEEIVQDLFASLWLKREELAILNLSHYLFVAVKRRIIDRARSQFTKAKYWEYCKNHISGYDTSTEETVVYNDLTDQLEAAIRALPEKSQLIFRLNRFEGRSVSEISKSLKLSERAIEYHITRSLEHLRMHLRNFTLMLVLFLIP